VVHVFTENKIIHQGHFPYAKGQLIYALSL
jgi:hypothetical protein